jgi:hypothetical protein
MIQYRIKKNKRPVSGNWLYNLRLSVHTFDAQKTLTLEVFPFGKVFEVTVSYPYVCLKNRSLGRPRIYPGPGSFFFLLFFSSLQHLMEMVRSQDKFSITSCYFRLSYYGYDNYYKFTRLLILKLIKLVEVYTSWSEHSH